MFLFQVSRCVFFFDLEYIYSSNCGFRLLVLARFCSNIGNMAKFAVFPAAGNIGSSIYTHLFKLLPPKELLLISRNPEKIPSHMLQAGVATRKADYNNADSLDHVFDGVSCLILISYPSIESDHRFKVRLCPW